MAGVVGGGSVALRDMTANGQLIFYRQYRAQSTLTFIRKLITDSTSQDKEVNMRWAIVVLSCLTF